METFINLRNKDLRKVSIYYDETPPPPFSAEFFLLAYSLK